MEAPNGVRKKCVSFWIGNEGEKPHGLSSWHTTLDLNSVRNRHLDNKGSISEDESVVEITELWEVSADP
eukprot:13954791-Ditylum_brightwellii.AAC.1